MTRRFNDLRRVRDPGGPVEGVLWMLGAILAWIAFIALLVHALPLVSAAHATWKPEFGKSPAAVQQWFRDAAPTPAARARLNIFRCCEKAERLMTKFVGRPGGEWSYYPDPACTAPGCRLTPLPNDIVHEDAIRAPDPKDDGLPEFAAMRREGVLFIWDGKPTCFWPPEGGI
jgi:hypothetical protein